MYRSKRSENEKTFCASFSRSCKTYNVSNMHRRLNLNVAQTPSLRSKNTVVVRYHDLRLHRQLEYMWDFGFLSPKSWYIMREKSAWRRLTGKTQKLAFSWVRRSVFPFPWAYTVKYRSNIEYRILISTFDGKKNVSVHVHVSFKFAVTQRTRELLSLHAEPIPCLTSVRARNRNY